MRIKTEKGATKDAGRITSGGGVAITAERLIIPGQEGVGVGD